MNARSADVRSNNPHTELFKNVMICSTFHLEKRYLFLKKRIIQSKIFANQVLNKKNPRLHHSLMQSGIRTDYLIQFPSKHQKDIRSIVNNLYSVMLHRMVKSSIKRREDAIFAIFPYRK